VHTCVRETVKGCQKIDSAGPGFKLRAWRVNEMENPSATFSATVLRWPTGLCVLKVALHTGWLREQQTVRKPHQMKLTKSLPTSKNTAMTKQLKMKITSTSNSFRASGADGQATYERNAHHIVTHRKEAWPGQVWHNLMTCPGSRLGCYRDGPMSTFFKLFYCNGT